MRIHRPLFVSVMSLLLVTASAPPVRANDQIDHPRSRATFSSPTNGSTQAGRTVTLSGTLSANGNAYLVGKSFTITPLVGDVSFSSIEPAGSEQITELRQTVTFATANEVKTFTFSNVPLIYQNQNYLTLLVQQVGAGDASAVTPGPEPVNPGDPSTDEVSVNYSGNQLPIYRFWSPRFNNAHFFTQNADEKNNLIFTDNYDYQPDGNWRYEGRAFTATLPGINGSCPSGLAKVFRHYSSNFRSHFYTINATESTNLASDPNWTSEGGAYCANTTEVAGTTDLYRFWSPRFKKHFYTANQAERDQLVTNDNYASGGNWTPEGTDHYVIP